MDASRAVVAQKIRTKNKDFIWKGDRKAVKGLYGQWLWKGGGKMIVITEGEIDALSVSQAQGNKWPVVSLVDGASSAEKGIKESLEYLETFERVILFFDNDEPGKLAVEKVKKLFSPGRCYIAQLPDDLKDANDCLKAGRSKVFIDAIWNAKQFKPDGLIGGLELLRKLENRPEVISYPYPDTMPELQRMTYGIRFSQLDIWTSGTGMGKSTVLKALQDHFYKSTPFNQCLLHIEERLEDTVDALIGYDIGARVHLPDVRKTISDEVYDKSKHDLFASVDANGHPRFQLYDAFGTTGGDENLYNMIRYAAKGLNCKIFWLDHISILVSDTAIHEDERRRIDRLITTLTKLAVELDVYIAVVSHLKKAPQGKSFEEGHTPSADDLRGSASLKQLAFGVYALSRNQQHSDPISRNTTTITVLKCRFTGRTGTADHLLFEDSTGRLVPGSDPKRTDGFEKHTNGPSEY
ncbi:MAG: toprim domain-containing protein [Cohaesibacteraceae bacterium]|nr:toprim domain-containing protein [Cohaesibacteraceae bacterium]